MYTMNVICIGDGGEWSSIYYVLRAKTATVFFSLFWSRYDGAVTSVSESTAAE